MLLKIAFRNILRSGRRSTATILAVAVGALALVVFGAFQTAVLEGLETNAVQSGGHLTVFHRGYFLFAAGNPAGYGIDYQSAMKIFATDAVLNRLVAVETPILALNGIAGNFSGGNDASKTFLGSGIVPSDRDAPMERIRRRTSLCPRQSPNRRRHFSRPDRRRHGAHAEPLRAARSTELSDAAPRPVASARVNGVLNSAEIADSVRRNAPGPSIHTTPSIDLLAATAGGAPNVVSLEIGGLSPQIAKELDDSYVAMNLRLAQRSFMDARCPR